jgi:Pyridoxamine 5'-phosphate oxidase
VAGAPEPSAGEDRPATEMLDLSREECLRLLAEHSFGRLAVNMGKGPPVIRPVNYLFDQPSQSVVFRTALGSKFHALLQSADAAFEIDGIDQGSGTGWSVIMDVRRLDGLRLQPWAPGHKAHWVHIRAWTVSGRRIVLAADNVPGYGHRPAATTSFPAATVRAGAAGGMTSAP